MFNSNLRISGNGYLLSEVKRRRIRLKPAYWINVVHMKYEGQKLCFANISYDFPLIERLHWLLWLEQKCGVNVLKRLVFEY